MAQQLFASASLPVASVTTGERKAALLLHSMNTDDQQWLLAQLPATHRALLQDLLAEIKEFGISTDRHFLDQVLANPALVSKPDASVMNSEMIFIDDQLAAFEQAAPEVIADALRAEPYGLIACFLALHNWPWERRFLNHLNPLTKRQVEERLTILRQAGTYRQWGANALRAAMFSKIRLQMAEVTSQHAPYQVVSARVPRSVANWLGNLYRFLGAGTWIVRSARRK